MAGAGCPAAGRDLPCWCRRRHWQGHLAGVQLIAYVTTGKPAGSFPLPPAQTGKVLLLAGEDDPGKVLKARLLPPEPT